MIIVYYDSAVQTAFEELVKFVSGNRNAMRKGKMAAKMAEMRRAAEMEADEESSDDSEDDTSTPLGSVIPKPSSPNNTKANGHHSAENTNGDLTPKLNFVSTRQMGPPRDRIGRDNIGNTMNMLKGYRRAGGVPPGATLDIFDELDKGLEWCQSQCEHAAHQFLRDGDCSTEIENIKQKLQEVKEAAEKKLEKLAADEKEERKREEQKEKERLLKPVKQPVVKIAPAPVQRVDIPLNLEVDDSMEVDDEEDDVDVDFDPRKLIFKRSRDVAY
jgi:Skp family chaperone for outer membrane proteins